VIRRHPGRTLVVVVVLVVWGLITHGTFAGSGDEPHYLIIAHSLAFDRDLDLANNYRDATLITAGALEPESHARMHGGRLRPVHDIGMPLLFAPAVRLAYPAAEALGRRLPPAWMEAARLNEGLLLRHQISLLMAFVAGLLARELFRLFRDAGGSGPHAFWWALLFVLSPPILSHAFLFFTEVPTALVALVVFRRLSVRPVGRPAAALGLGLLAGLLLLMHARNVGLAAGLSAVALLQVRRGTIAPAAGGAFMAGVAAMVGVRTIAIYTMWGTFLTTPHAAPGAAAPLMVTLQEVFIRTTGLLIDREHGLLTYAPIYLLAVAGLVAGARRRTPLWRDLFIVLAAYLVPILIPQINFHGWRGGWSPAARFLVPVAPLLCLAAYACIRSAPRRLVLALAALQVAMSAYVWQFPKTLWNEGTGEAAFPLARWLPTWTEPTLEQHLLFGAALGAILAFGIVVANSSRGRERAGHEPASRHAGGAGGTPPADGRHAEARRHGGLHER
jgi:hypothetical protein